MRGPPAWTGRVEWWAGFALWWACSGCQPPREPAQATPAPTAPRLPATQSVPVSERDPSGRIRFEDRAAAAGVAFTPRNGQEAGHLAILETLGVGVALEDFDRDGALDLFVPGGGEFGPGPAPRGLPPAFFRQILPWQFRLATRPAGLDEAPFYSHGASVADYDADGFADLLLTGYGGLRLYRNQGDGTFVDVSATARLVPPLWATSAAWGDFDGDQVLDLYVCQYVDWSFQNHPACIVEGHRDTCPPGQFQGLDDLLYRGQGDGTFVETHVAAGLAAGGKGLAVLAGDVDLDGDLDLYVGNDATPNFLYRNAGQGRFVEIGLLSGTALGERNEPDGSMGVDLGDFNLDGRPDLWVANYENQSFALYRNEGDAAFHHVSSVLGIAAVGGVYVGFGTLFGDFDHDGDEDLFAATGHVMYHSRNAPLAQRPLVFENLAGRRFVNVAHAAGAYTATAHVARGVAAGDLDGDGDLDLVVAHTNQPVSVLENVSNSAGSGFRLELVGTRAPRRPIGARITVRSGEHARTRQLKGGTSYLSTSEAAVHFGCPAEWSEVACEVLWPGGRVSVCPGLATGRTWQWVEGADKPREVRVHGRSAPIGGIPGGSTREFRGRD